MLYDRVEDLWSRLPELNRRPSNYESDALPTELSRLFSSETPRCVFEEWHYTNAQFVVSSRASRRKPASNKTGVLISGFVSVDNQQPARATNQHEILLERFRCEFGDRV